MEFCIQLVWTLFQHSMLVSSVKNCRSVSSRCFVTTTDNPSIMESRFAGSFCIGSLIPGFQVKVEWRKKGAVSPVLQFEPQKVTGNVKGWKLESCPYTRLKSHKYRFWPCSSNNLSFEQVNALLFTKHCYVLQPTINAYFIAPRNQPNFSQLTPAECKMGGSIILWIKWTNLPKLFHRTGTTSRYRTFEIDGMKQ